MDPTARTENVKARVLSYLSGLTITGSPTIADSDEPGRTNQATPWARVVLDFDPGFNDGDLGAQIVYRSFVLVTIDLFFPSGDNGTSQNLYAIDLAADEYADAMRNRSLSFLNYVADPSSPATIANAEIQFDQPLIAQRIPQVSGYVRRQVVTRGRYHLRH